MRAAAAAIVVSLASITQIGALTAEASAAPFWFLDLAFEDKLLVASDGAGKDKFGISADVDGDTIVVGASADDIGRLVDPGSAYVYERNYPTAGAWGQVAKLTAGDLQASDQYGISVAISGNTIVVGAHAEDTGVLTGGKVYVYERNEGGANNWGEVARIVNAYVWPADPAAKRAEDDRFGQAVAIDGNTIAVGTPRKWGPGGATDKGHGYLYVFQRDPANFKAWTQVVARRHAFSKKNDQLGASVSISGSTIVAGAPGRNSNTGSAYVYERNHGGADNWGQVVQLRPASTVSGDTFGRTVAISGNTIVGGAHRDDDRAKNSGAVYVFERSGGVWAESKTLTASDAAAEDQFGTVVAISGDMLVVSAIHDLNIFGSAYLLERNAGGPGNWGEVEKYRASNGRQFDWFGKAVATTSNTAVIGAPFDPSKQPNPPVFPGRAFVFELSPVAPLPTFAPGYVLDGWGGVHAGGGAVTRSPATPYFGFDAAVDMELAATGYYVLDLFGGVHAGGGAPVLAPETPYWAWDIAGDLELTVNGGFYVMDRLGGVHAGGGAPDLSPQPYWGWDIGADLELVPNGYYVLDRWGGVHTGGGAPEMSPETPYWVGFGIARDMELAATGYYVLDGFGGLHAGGGAPLRSPATPFFGFDIARDLELTPTGYYVLDGFGGVHAGGGAPAMTPATPYFFGFDIARDLELQ